MSRRPPTFRPNDGELRIVPLFAPFVLWPEVTHGKAIFRYDFRTLFENFMRRMMREIGCP